MIDVNLSSLKNGTEAFSAAEKKFSAASRELCDIIGKLCKSEDADFAENRNALVACVDELEALLKCTRAFSDASKLAFVQYSNAVRAGQELLNGNSAANRKMPELKTIELGKIKNEMKDIVFNGDGLNA